MSGHSVGDGPSAMWALGGSWGRVSMAHHVEGRNVEHGSSKLWQPV